jgi:hypothetical protein
VSRRRHGGGTSSVGGVVGCGQRSGRTRAIGESRGSSDEAGSSVRTRTARGANLAMYGDHQDAAGQLVAGGQVPGVDEFGSLAHAEWLRLGDC